MIRWLNSYPSSGSAAQYSRTAAASNSKPSTAVAVTAPNAHVYGVNIHDQPSSSPMPMVSMTTGPSPGTCRSSVTWPDWISQNRVALPPSSKSRYLAGNLTSRAASASTPSWSQSLARTSGKAGRPEHQDYAERAVV